jgi:hypothetical protein
MQRIETELSIRDECGTLNSSPMCSVRSATTSGLGTDLRWRTLQLAQRARTGTRIDPFRSCGCRLNRPTRPIHDKKSQKGIALSEKWRISRVGKLELEVGETLQEAIIRLQILPLPPLAWTDCFLQTVRGHEVTIIGTETHPDKIEAVARPAEVEDVLGKIDSAIENANEYVEKVVRPRRQADRDVKGAEADERQKLQAELDQLAEKLSKPEYAEDAGPD